MIICAHPIANALKYNNHSEYIIWFALIIGMDAISTIPFAKLRQLNRPVKYATFKTINIGINVALNLFFLLLCPYLLKSETFSWTHGFISAIFNPKAVTDLNVLLEYVFISNLIASAATLVMVFPEVLTTNIQFSKKLWLKIMEYTLPLIIVGLAGMVNETMDRILLKFYLPLPLNEIHAQIGIYGANYKLTLLITLFVQAYRMAAEPFFFNQSKEKDAKQVYAQSMKYFILICLTIFLMITLYIDIFKYFIGKDYYAGLNVVPILLLANMFLGAYYNLSIWYKLTNKTKTGAWIAIGGAIITLVINIGFIPRYGYMASAWATFICYGSMMAASYFIGQVYYPVNYHLKQIISYSALALALYFISTKLIDPMHLNHFITLALNTILFLGFLVTIYVLEFRKQLEIEHI
jgi:O-antigen/teichoic acid export membrane protein